MFKAETFLNVKRNETEQQDFIDYRLRSETHEDKSNE
jgi:hypothetical protein